MGAWPGPVGASGGDSVSNRAHLKWLVRRIADEACKRIDDPKNTAKGDGWREMGWGQLNDLARFEQIELADALRGDGDPIWEAADKLVIDAMRVDKAGAGDNGKDVSPQEATRVALQWRRRGEKEWHDGPLPGPGQYEFAGYPEFPTSGKES